MNLKVVAFLALLAVYFEASDAYSFDISTHVLDSHKGRPGSRIAVTLFKQKNGENWTPISKGITGSNGRISQFASSSDDYTAGVYKLHFETKEYFSSNGEKTFYPVVDIVFNVDDPKEHYHVPLLLNAYGYTTYRGSLFVDFRNNK